MTNVDVLTKQTLGGLTVRPVEDSIDYINLLVYGDPGVGKTVLAASASLVPEMSPVLFIDVEGGMLSAASMGFEVDVVRVQTWRDMQKVYDALYDEETEYRTVVLDSLTEIQKFSMLNIMKEVMAADGSRDPDIPSIREWGKNIEQTRKTVRAFRDLPVNTILTALAMSDKDPRTNLTKTKPSLSGKLSNEVAGFFDEVLYYYVKMVDKELRRYILTDKTDKEEAKDRSGRLPRPVMEAPTMRKIYDCMFNPTTETGDN